MNRDPLRSDVLDRASAQAHRDAYPDDKACAKANGVHRATPNRWSTAGKGSPLRRFAAYFDAAPDKARLIVALKVTEMQLELRKLSTADLVALYWRTSKEDADDECEERKAELWGEDWLDLAHAAEKDATSDLRKAACLREFAVRRITRAEVMGR